MFTIKRILISSMVIISFIITQVHADRTITIINMSHETIYLAVNPQQSRCASSIPHSEITLLPQQQQPMQLIYDKNCRYLNPGSVMVGIRFQPGIDPQAGANDWFEAFANGPIIFDQIITETGYKITTDGTVLTFATN